MKFYQVVLRSKFKTSKVKKENDNSPARACKIISDAGKRFSEYYFKTTGSGSMFFIFDVFQDSIYCGLATSASDNFTDYISYIMGFPWDKINVTIDSMQVEEITSKSFGEITMIAKTSGFFYKPLGDYIRIFNPGPLYNLQDGFDGAICGYTEDVLSQTDSQKKEDLLLQTKSMMWNKDLGAEVQRIFETRVNLGIKCHPVHYFIESDNSINREYALRVLLNSLYKNRRITSRRISYLYSEQLRMGDLSFIDEMFRLATGSTVVVDMSKSAFYNNISEDEVSMNEGTFMELCSIIKKYRNSVLIVFYLPKKCSDKKSKIYEELQDFCFVEMTEDPITEDMLKGFLKFKAQELKIELDDSIIKTFENSEKIKTIDDANKLFESWYANKIKQKYYTNYSSFEIAKKYASTEKKTDAMQELDKMIGLEKAKETIKQAIDYYKIQKLYKDRGLNKDKPTMHMIFKGDPGTAKTSVARLFAKIMKENKILKCGHLVECGRADLVGKYVGWTANQVKKKFEEAKEGVLFLDEIYSLVDDRDGSFGDEAINTIVQEMENHRDEVVVIFAGYPDKMEEFLNKNPGLRSRIGFHIDFSNYNTKDLIQITEKIATDQGLTIDKKAYKKLEGIYDKVKDKKDFGNGRFCRNIIDHAKLKQATRLIHTKDYDNLSNKELLTLKSEDFEYTDNNKEENKEIGFKG